MAHLGRTRSEQEKNLRKEGMQTLTNEQLAKCKYLEKKHGSWKGSFFRQNIIDKLK